MAFPQGNLDDRIEDPGILLRIRIFLWFLRRYIKVALISLSNRVILVTGIPRSGSTLVFNICRFLWMNENRKVNSYWINDLPWRICRKQVFVLKIHDYDPFIASLPLMFIHNTRNLGEIAASSTIKRQKEPSIEQIREFQFWDINWRKKSDLLLDYQEILNLDYSTKKIAELFKLKNVPIEEIKNEIDSLEEAPLDGEYDKSTLINLNHRTGAGQRWKEILSDELIREIEKLD